MGDTFYNGDGLPDYPEFRLSLNPQNPDSDGDWVWDFDEYSILGMYPDIFDVTGPTITFLDWNPWQSKVVYKIEDPSGLKQAYLEKDLVSSYKGKDINIPEDYPGEYYGEFNVWFWELFSGFTATINATDSHGNYNAEIMTYDGVFIYGAQAASMWYLNKYQDTFFRAAPKKR